ncbi:MAG: cell division protein FtsL, partial [Alphaproteobacteria bacterium]|nr:cell division protein FtsL [Alphaproteobacteria bacterium]
MKLLKPRTFVIFALAGLAGAILLHTSQNVQHAQERLEALEQSVQREEEKIRMLKAEWETLNRPERLERLANEFLDLVPPSPDQMTGKEVHLPESVPSEFVLPEVESASSPVLQPVVLQPPKPQVKPNFPPPLREGVRGRVLDIRHPHPFPPPQGGG